MKIKNTIRFAWLLILICALVVIIASSVVYNYGDVEIWLSKSVLKMNIGDILMVLILYLLLTTKWITK